MDTPYKVARLGHPLIRGTNAPVTREELLKPEFQAFIDSMIAIMREYNGVGIAAPQVHWAKQLFAVEVNGANPRYPGQRAIPLLVVVNPVWVKKEGEAAMGWEGCLSVPDLRGKVPRYQHVALKGWDRRGNDIQIDAVDFFARVLQHEMDHLEGKVYLDRMKDLSTLTHLQEFAKYALLSD